MQPAPQLFQFVLAGANVLMDFVEMAAQLRASIAEPIDGGAGALLGIGEIAQERLCVLPHRVQLGAGLSELLQSGLLIELKLRPLLGVQLAFDLQKPHLLLVHVPDAGDGFVLLLDRLSFLLQFGAPGIDLILQFPLALVELLVPFVEAGEFRLIFLQALGDILVSGGDFLGAAMELFLQRLARLLALYEVDAALLLGLAFQIEAGLRFGELREPTLQDSIGIGVLLARLLQLFLLHPQPFILQPEPVLRFLELADGRFHRGAAFDPLLAVDFVGGPVGLTLGKPALGLLMLLRQLGLAGFLAGTLLVKLLLAGAHLIAHAFQSAAQGGKRRLLPFELGGPFRQLPGEGILLLLLRRQALGLGCGFLAQVIELGELMLQFAGILPKLFALLRHLVGLLSELAFALFEGALQAIEPKHVGFVLLDARFKRLRLKPRDGCAWALVLYTRRDFERANLDAIAVGQFVDGGGLAVDENALRRRQLAQNDAGGMTREQAHDARRIGRQAQIATEHAADEEIDRIQRERGRTSGALADLQGHGRQRFGPVGRRGSLGLGSHSESLRRLGIRGQGSGLGIANPWPLIPSASYKNRFRRNLEERVAPKETHLCRIIAKRSPRSPDEENAMKQPVADRNLLFGILAMQMDFITREQLIAAMQAWVFDKTKPLGEILVAQKALAADNRQLLEALVQKHLAQHGNDAEKSLAAVSSVASVKKDLEKIADADVQASLVHVAAAPGKAPDPYATVAPSLALRHTGQRFRIVRPHAKGGLGEVYVARDEELHREVALKEIQDRHADNPESRSRFMVEAEITGGLEHPGIVPVYGLGTYDDGRPYYAMRFIRGDSLKDAIERFHKTDRGALDAGERALQLRALLGRFIDVCNAIAYAHSRGVLHRDLKPGNIMLGKYGETLVVDWGLAKPLGEQQPATQATEPGEGSLIPNSLSAASHTLVGSAVGTPQYMSPEQAAGRIDQLGPASDVYSLGATLFCLLTGQPPIGDRDVGSVLQKVQRGDIPRPRSIKPDVPIPLEAVCMKAMALKPEDRYASPLALALDVEQWLADEPVSAWPEPWTVKARRWIGRHRMLVTGAAAAIAVALVSLSIATVLLTAANDRERQARKFAEDQKEEADRQRKQAEKNFQMVRAAVDRYHTEVSESVLLREPGMEPLRKKLLEAAREYYSKFVQDRADDPAVRGELGRATYRLAQITGEIDSEPKAITLHQQAVKVFESLPAGQASADTQADLADCWTQLGRLLVKNQHQGEGADALRKALGLWDALAKDPGKEPRFQAGLARAEFYLGNAFQQNRDLGNALKSYQDAIAVRSKLAQAHPKVAEYQRDLAVSYSNLARIYGDQDKKKDAEKEYRAAQAIQKQLADDAPYIGQYQDDLARTHGNLGDLLGPPRASAEYAEALKIRKKLAERHPSVINYQSMLALAYLANSRSGVAGAEGAIKEAVEIQRKLAAEHKKLPDRQYELSQGLFSLGEFYRATGNARKAVSAYQDAVEIQNRLVSADATALLYQAALARTYQGMGLAYLRDKETEPAADTFKQAAIIWEKLTKQKPREIEYNRSLATTQVLHAGALARLGRYSEATAIIDALTTQIRDGDLLCHFARIYSGYLAGADNPKLADHYAAQVLRMLSAAQKAGFFEAQANRDKLKTDPDLHAVRQRSEFMAWLGKLEGK